MLIANAIRVLLTTAITIVIRVDQRNCGKNYGELPRKSGSQPGSRHWILAWLDQDTYTRVYVAQLVFTETHLGHQQLSR